MRTIGIISFLVLLGVPTATDTLIPASSTEKPHFDLSKLKVTAFHPPAINHQLDTAALKQSSWYAEALEKIRESEYEIKGTENPLEFVSPNRQQNLKAIYTPDRYRIESRMNKDWTLDLSLKGIYTGKELIYAPQKDAGVLVAGNNIQFNHAGNFIAEYHNSTKGIRQNFIILKAPSSPSASLRVQLQTGRGWQLNQVHPTEIHFSKLRNGIPENKIIYNDLKVWDACDQELPACFITKGNTLEISVNTTGAVYPITIDPLSTSPSAQLEINQADAAFGTSLSTAGDVNGDGYSDVIVGAPAYDNLDLAEGGAFIFHGSSTGISTSIAVQLEQDQAGAAFGSSVATAGDVNNDGYSDVIVGAALADFSFTDEGAAFIYHGSPTGVDNIAETQLESGQDNARFGARVATAGDINGDGFSDVIVGAFNYDNGQTNEGAVFVCHGSASGVTAVAAVLDSDQTGAIFGISLAPAGDVNGDGFSDIIVGASLFDNPQTDEGAIFIFEGAAGGINTTPAIQIESDQAGAHLGNAVSSAGDVNGDGYSDVIAGALWFNNGELLEGAAFIYYGSAAGITGTIQAQLEMNQPNAQLGISVAGAGDINGDGYADVMVGANFYSNGEINEGAAFVYYGSATGVSLSPRAQLETNQADAQFGIALSFAGDINGDGYSDLLIGAPYFDNSESNEGLAFIYNGSPDGLPVSPTTVRADGTQANDNFGVSVASAGDVNGDGYSDVIIGAWQYDESHVNEGAAFVYHGGAAGLSATPNSSLFDCNQAGAFFGEAVAGAGDLNGDGYADVIIGADNYDDAGGNNEGRAFVYFGSASGINGSPVILDDTDQDNANFGVSVAGAGDVNGDGYSDVLIGAIGITDLGNPNEGLAFLHYGNASGVSATPNSTLDDADKADSYFGWSVASAGDVNGDGCSDVIVGAPRYDAVASTDEGRVFIYHGGFTGLNASPNTTLQGDNQAFARFGESVASAGDINGDGFSDVIAGAPNYTDGPNTGEGRAYLYIGSAGGINPAVNATPDDADQVSASFGISVASAGDVNGDGYSDIIIGAIYYDNSPANEGGAFVYYGSSTGLSASPASIFTDANESDAWFGYSVASAGDINGDGFSDVIIGAHRADDALADEGKAFIYYGNRSGGLQNNLRLYNIDLITPITRANIGEGSLFGAGLFGKSPVGRSRGRMTWEVKIEGQPFSGNPITNSTAYLGRQSSWTDLGLNGTELKNQVQKPGFQHKIRARVEYQKSTAINGQMYGPWRYPPGYLQGGHGMYSTPLPVQFISFTAIRQDQQALLTWHTAEEKSVVYYEVQHGRDGIHFTTLTSIAANHLDRNIYQWVHSSPGTGKNFYRILAISNDKRSFTQVKMVNFQTMTEVLVYPQPAHSGQEISLRIPGLVQGQPIRLQLFGTSGNLLWAKNQTANGNLQLPIQLPYLPAGFYLLRTGIGSAVYETKLIVK